jgi:formylmethanofuran dehydrogenase subunit E
MGVIARSMLKPQHHGDLAVIVFVNPKPPASCAVDGVQVSSGCTLGKGTIQVSESAKGLVGEFHAGDRTCTVTVEPNLLSGLLDGLRNATEKEVAEMAEGLLGRPDDEVFHITRLA